MNYKQTFIDMIKENGIDSITLKSLCVVLGIHTKEFLIVTGSTFTQFKYHVCLEYLLDIGLCQSIIDGYDNITLEQISEMSHTKLNTIKKFFGTVQTLRCKVLLHAIDKEHIQITLDALGNDDPLVRDISYKLRKKVSDYILKDV